MNPLKQGMTGAAVKRWQFFLIGQGFPVKADGDFGPKTHAATIAFQTAHGLLKDGIVGGTTYEKAISLGFPDPNWPYKPSFAPLSSNAARASVFGKFSYQSAPTTDNPEAIRILGDWEAKNILRVEIPQLIGISGAPADGKIRFHKLGAEQLQALWQAWEDAGLLNRVKTWEGSFVPRFVRGSRTTLSNHAFGSAFDINYSWNKLGATPARLGEPGCVRELVALANQHGFYWGGHFTRLDGMHFEVAKLL